MTSVPSPESLHLGTGSGSSFRGVARSPTASRSRAADLCEGVSARGSNEEPPLPTAGRANNSFFSSLANGGCERRASGDRPRRGDRRPAPLLLSGPPLGSTGAEPRRGGSQKYDGDVGDDDQSVCTSAPRFWGVGGWTVPDDALGFRQKRSWRRRAPSTCSLLAQKPNESDGERGGLRSRRLLSHSSGGRKSKVQVAQGRLRPRPLPGLQTAPTRRVLTLSFLPPRARWGWGGGLWCLSLL